MVTIAPPQSRPARLTLRCLTRNLMVLLSAVAGGIFLVQFRKLLLPSQQDLIVTAPVAYYTPGLRTRSFGPTCRYYLAESAIGPNSGLGLFTAIGIAEGEMLGIPDICIYVADTPKRTDFHTHSWAQDVFFGQFEGDDPRAACEGFATLFNSLPAGVQNAKLNSPRVQTNGGLDRHRNPGAGAITHYFGIQSSATDIIPAGSELTIDYGDFPYDENTKYQKPVRPVAWLREHGMCIDNLVVGPAVDPEMGRGAFATRLLLAGTTVAPAPLQVFRNRSDFAKQTPESLFVNYNFQFPGSDMMLFPYGPGVNLINHDREKANVVIRWSTSEFHHANWLTLPANKFWKKIYPGALILDVVATRDIRQGEELFMDYGQDWEDAWNKHVREWKPPVNDNYFYPADVDETAALRTVVEQENDPYPENLAMICNTPDWERKKDNEIKWYQPNWEFPEGFVPCHILARKQDRHGDYVYKVMLEFDGPKQFNPLIKPKDRYLDYKVPRRAIRFVDKPYHSDQHIKDSFRHPIAFPDHLVPLQWKHGF